MVLVDLMVCPSKTRFPRNSLSLCAQCDSFLYGKEHELILQIENFAGRDASRGLAFGSFDEDMLTKDLEGPLDTLDDLGESEKEALRGWEERFEEKYLVVGKLVACGEEVKKES